jgi:hypothetical protein
MGERFLLGCDVCRTILRRRYLPDHHRDIARRTEQNSFDDVLEHLRTEVRFLPPPASRAAQA